MCSPSSDLDCCRVGGFTLLALQEGEASTVRLDAHDYPLPDAEIVRSFFSTLFPPFGVAEHVRKFGAQVLQVSFFSGRIQRAIHFSLLSPQWVRIVSRCISNRDPR